MRIIDTDALTLARQIRAKEVSPVAVIEAVLRRIEALQPVVNAFITVTAEEARDAARRAEAALMAGEPLGPLHGVPFSVKDLLFTRGVRTTMGSAIFADQVPGEDAVASAPGRRVSESGPLCRDDPADGRGDSPADAANVVFARLAEAEVKELA